MNQQPAGLYIHVPFCVHRCSYCDFFKTTDANSENQRSYADALFTELDLLSKTQPDTKMETLYLGGGTPSLLEPQFMEGLIHRLRTYFSWSESAEWTLEANPETVDLEKLKQLFKLGFNRISFGVQSFNPTELEMLERRHTPGRAEMVVAWARQAGFDQVSLDIMTALPGQTWQDVLPSLDKVLELDVDHLSVYQLELHPGTPLAQKRESLPSLDKEDEHQEEIFLNTSKLLADNGYGHYEISNFAKPGCESQHNLRYWRRQPVWAAGPSAHGFDGSVQYANPAAMGPWQKPLNENRLPWKWSRTVSLQQKQKDRWVFGLRLQEGINKIDLPPKAEGLLEDLLAAGWLQTTDNGLRMTPAGWVRSNEILARFMPEE